jgi:predicted histone-like DNA-binding protein
VVVPRGTEMKKCWVNIKFWVLLPGFMVLFFLCLIWFGLVESPANDGEKKKYHVRNTNKQTIHSKDLIHEATLYTSVSRSDWAAVVEGLIDILSEKLGDGKRIHINGLGYFSVSIGSTESENPKKMTRGTVQITRVTVAQLFFLENSFPKHEISTSLEAILERFFFSCSSKF